jgi:hypothetical protein
VSPDAGYSISKRRSDATAASLYIIGPKSSVQRDPNCILKMRDRALFQA